MKVMLSFQALLYTVPVAIVSAAPTSLTVEAPLLDNINPFASAILDFKRDIEAAQASTVNGQLAKRSVMTRALTARYNYHCPHGVESTRDFTWQAVYDPTDHSITMVAFKNINKWSTVLTHGMDFSAFWYHSFCAPTYGSICEFSFQGYTDGRVSGQGIILELITTSNLQQLMPKVEEFCVSLAHPVAGMCPAQIATGSTCRIDSIAVHAIN